MSKNLNALRPVYVVGVGLHRYQPLSDTPYVDLGLTAVRAALADGGIPWEANEATFFGTGLLGMAAGRAMLRHLGATGSSVVHLENASASGSAAFRAACVEVASGLADVALAVGVDKPGPVTHAFRHTGIDSLAEDLISLPSHFALVTSEYMSRHDVSVEDLARVAEKNHGNGAKNPFAHRQKARSIDDILSSKPVSGALTALQCCPVGEGAAAVFVMSADAVKRLGVAPDRPVRIASSVTRSEVVNDQVSEDARLTGTTVRQALADAQISALDLDVIELHDAFSIEELLYVEEMGMAPLGQASDAMRDGAFHIGGSCAVSPSGGLIAMGHPIGPTGIGQVVEIATQLRHKAGPRQQPDARFGLAHMCGLGTVCYAHVLTRE